MKLVKALLFICIVLSMPKLGMPSPSFIPPALATSPSVECQEYLSMAEDMVSKKEFANAIVQFNHVLRCDPSSSSARRARNRCLRLVLSSSEMSDPQFSAQRAAISQKIQELVNLWNVHDAEKMILRYFASYCDDDGETIGQFSRSLKEFWSKYPYAKTKWSIARILCDEKSALVEINGQIDGTTNDPDQGRGVLHSDFHQYLLLAYEEEQWFVSGSIQDRQNTLTTFGIGDQFGLELTTPTEVQPGKNFNARITFSVPKPYKANAGIFAQAIKTPRDRPASDNCRITDAQTENRELTMNSDGRNTIVTGFVFGTAILSNVGMAICERRVPVSDSDTETVASNGVSSNRNNGDGNTSSANSDNGASSNGATAGSIVDNGGSNDGSLSSSERGVKAAQSQPDSIDKGSHAGSLASKQMGKLASTNIGTETKTPIGDKWALIVGIEKFQDPKIGKLQFAAKDAIDVYRFLINEAHFAPDHVRLLLNEKATERRILSEVGSKFLARVARPNDLVLIYLSTHGSPSDLDVKGNNFFVAYDTDGHDLFATGIEMQKIVEIIKRRIDSQRVLLVLDACHSGATNPEGKALVRDSNFDANDISQGTGQLVICSSQPSERSWESRRYKNGVFTHRLLEGFRLNGANTKLIDAFSYLKDQVSNEVRADRGERQTPVIKSKWNGDELQLLVPPADPQPLPDTVRTELEPDSSEHGRIK